MIHIMKLSPKYFEYMQNGTKVIEIRLNDEKRKDIKIGDRIIFQKEPELKEEIITDVEELIFKNNFEELIESLDVLEYASKNETKETYLQDLYKFYKKEQEDKYGVVGIRIRKLKEEEKLILPASIIKESLYNINLDDDFFDSLRNDYRDFDNWFLKKQKEGAEAYIIRNEKNKITSFLMIKEEGEEEDYSNFEIPFKAGNRLKISTLKVADTGKKIGEYFINLVIEKALRKNIEEIYITTFLKQDSLIHLLKENGFVFYTYKETLRNDGTTEKEAVYVKSIKNKKGE